MAKITVPRAQITELLGLPPDVDDETLNREMERAIAHVGATAVSAAEQRARAEDRRIVIAAVNDGRLTKSRIEFWCDALSRDRTGNRAVLAALAPGLPPAQKVVDPDAERAERQVLARLGIKPPPQAPSPRPVAASGQASPSSPPVDMLGIPLVPQMPEPVRIFKGKDPATWSRQEQSDYFMHKLGPAVTRGGQVNRPPREDDWYVPSPHDTFEWVETGDGQGEFRPKSGNEARRVED
jgi:hypothetical protein